MSKRFTATEIWSEDWFLSMPNEYKLFWFYMLSTCDHAGLFKVNWRSFSGLVEVNLSSTTALTYFNTGKQRVRVIKDSLWLIEDFFVYQYGTTFNPKNRLHSSVGELYLKYKISLTSIRGLLDLKEGVKDKDIGTMYLPEDKKEEMLCPKMIRIFKEANPVYPEDLENDSKNCLKIAHKIAKQKGWMQNTVTNGNMSGVIESWRIIVNFVKDDNFFSKLALSGINSQWQGLIQSMSRKTQPLEKKEVFSAPPLKKL